ncbi:hypothetical protein M011DRAFT_494801 [Sporormia fimetaria CBS 119925]|uniref:Uncharacterized protein n=1 Tax=Sporormia fimetaria CBS 119925 TaxID=1340428 RepID=A0A6A6V950_9PLEO|nr:hypothetical protein M011DRAFT_494801 [Sporormia fimetaria CBS 119925]
MFHSKPQPLVHLPGKPTPSPDAPLPRGECGFILNECEAKGRQRCSCRSFFPTNSVVLSTCGCGHQAWHHEAQPLSTVTMEEYLAVVEEMKLLRQELRRYEHLEKDLKQEIAKERAAREDNTRIHRAVEQRMYENMQLLKVTMDDRVEAVVDKTQEFNDQIKAVQERLVMVDEVTMELENRVDRLEHPLQLSREGTPGASTPKVILKPALSPPQASQPSQMQPPQTLPIRADKKYPLSWSVRVIFVPRKALNFAYDPDSAGYRRCATRKLHQNLDFPSQDSSCFANRIENAFKGVLRGRAWMPMVGHRQADEPFGRMALNLLPQELVVRDVWDYPFLEDHCIAHDKMQGDILYITLQFEDVTWNEIRFLPPVTGADEGCWNHDEELDGTAKYRSLDSEIILDVLADSASLLSRVSTDSRAGPTQSSRSTLSSSHSSLRSFETEETDDEHRDKKPKLRGKQSIAGAHAQPMYVSGRSKRKMPVGQKGVKEPLHFSVSNVTKWRPLGVLHHAGTKGKEVAEGH